MRMTSLLYGLAALPLLTGAALAQPPQQSAGGASAKQPMQLSEQQMDSVTAGFLTIGGLVNTNFPQLQMFGPIFIHPLVAEDTAFQGLTIITLQNQTTVISFPSGSSGLFGL